MLRLGHACIALLAAIGCSPVSDNSNVPDAPIDSTDTRPPEIASSNPANMSNKASVLTPVSVFFDEQIDPATVTSTTVKLGYDPTIPMPLFPFIDLLKPHGAVHAGLTQIKGTVSYDAAGKKVSFVPAAPLPYGYVFVLALDVKDMGGVAFTGVVTFMTYVNGQTRQYSYNSLGAPSFSVVQPVDMAGRQTKRLNTSGAGTDTIWFTADDPKNQRQDFKFEPDGRILDERQFSSGSDGIYDTADDPINVCIKYTYNAERQALERQYATGAGPDTVWCTADDAINYNAVYQYMGATMTGWLLNSNAGADGTWHTSDDRCLYWWEYVYDAQGNKTRELARNCGSDQLSKTPDDTFYRYIDYEYDAAGYLMKMTDHYSAGNDAIWLNADDPPNSVERYERNADELVTGFWRSNGPGADAIWGNNDDPGQHSVTTYTAQKLAEDMTNYSSYGSDATWGTPDDVIQNYVKTTYDPLGNRIDQKTYNAGGDGMWRTPDDRVLIDNDFDLAH